MWHHFPLSDITLRLLDTTMSLFPCCRSIKIFIHRNCFFDSAKITSFFGSNSIHDQFFLVVLIFIPYFNRKNNINIFIFTLFLINYFHIFNKILNFNNIKPYYKRKIILLFIISLFKIDYICHNKTLIFYLLTYIYETSRPFPALRGFPEFR